MKKTIVSLLIAISAFLGVNLLNKVTINADTTPGVTYVTEGDRVYVHFGETTDNQTHFTNLLQWSVKFPSYFIDGITTLQVSTPDNYKGLYIETESGQIYKADMDESVPHEIEFWYEPWVEGLPYDSFEFDSDVGIRGAYNINDSDEHYNRSIDQVKIFFEIEEPPFVTFQHEGYRAYVHLGNLNMADHKLSIEDIFEYVPNQLTIPIPTGAVKFIYEDNYGLDYIASYNIREELTYITLVKEHGEYDSFIYFNSDAGDIVFIENGGTEPIRNISDNFTLYFIMDGEPVITPKTVIVNVSNPLTESQIRSQLSAIDDFDGDISHLINYVGGTYEEARLSNSLEINTSYSLNYQVTDSSNNTTNATISVEVVDITAPTFGITNSIIEVPWKENSTFVVEELFYNLLASDNYDSYEDLVFEVISSEYSHDPNALNTYDVTYRVSDTSGNSSDITVTIKVVDVDAPEFVGPTEFTVPFNKKTPISVILSNANSYAIDYFDDTDLTTTILSNPYTNATTLGTKDVEIRYTDKSGNYLDVIIKITLVDNMAPVMFVTPNFVIATDIFNDLTIEQIISIIERSYSFVTYDVVTNNYAGNETQLGSYEVKIEITDANNNVQTITPIILVANSDIDYHIVSFVTNGGTLIESKVVEDMSKVIVQNPKKTGFTFVGWYKDEALTQSFSIVSDVITSDTTLYAKWTPNTSGGSTIIENIKDFNWSDYLILIGLLAVGLYLGSKSKKR